jgi:5-(carboxyamino)imidazole ribonucleotide synthase
VELQPINGQTMQNFFSSDFKLGILGGGQLGKMMLYETRKFDIQTYVMDANPEAPCRIACNHFEEGPLTNYDAVLKFGRKVDVLTFEIETVNVDALEALEKEGKAVYPSSKTLRTIQNKGIQKQFYKNHGIPTADFEVYPEKANLNESVIRKEWDFPFVWKSTMGGYDGKGVSMIREEEDLIPLPKRPCLAEKKIDFKNELAVIVARRPSGEVKTYPVVEMEFHPEANQVEYVICPARIDFKVAEKAREVALNVVSKLDFVGLLAVEMFQTENDEILVNEVAPRTHNSGHTALKHHTRVSLNNICAAF